MNKKTKIISEDINWIVNTNLDWFKLKNKTVLITGGNGFIASYIILSLLEVSKKYKLNIKLLSIIRKQSKPKIKHRNLKVLKVDLESITDSNIPKADIVIHAASKASPKYFEKEFLEIIKTNTLSTINLMKIAIKRSEKFLFISSGEVYGEIENSNVTIDENYYGKINHLNTRSVYAESKRIGELICKSYANNKKLKVMIARLFHTYGPGINLHDGRVFSDFVNSVINQKDIVLNSNGDSKRPFCYISDAIIGLFTVLLKGKHSNAYNIANPKSEIRIKDLAILLSELDKRKKINIKYKITKNMSNPLKRQRVSIAKIKKLNWTPKIGLKKGFENTISHYQEGLR